jgi:hypothetical protein
MIWYKLVEIHAELTCLKRDFGASNARGDDSIRSNEPMESRLQESLEQLQTILEDLKPDKTKPEPDSSSPIQKEEEAKETVPSNPAVTSTLTEMVGESPAASSPERTQAGERNSQQSVPQSTPPNIPITDANLANAPILTLRQAVINLIRENGNERAALKVGAQIMFLYVNNLSNNPHVPKYRKLFTSTENFQKVDKLSGARDFLYSLGFCSRDKYLEWSPPPPQSSVGDETQSGPSSSTGTLTSQERGELVKTYHLAEAAEALKVLRMIQPKNDDSHSNSEEEATLSLLEKVLEILPYPPASASSSAVARSDTKPSLSPADATTAPQQSASSLLPLPEESTVPAKKTYAEAMVNDKVEATAAAGTELQEEEETNAVWK